MTVWGRGFMKLSVIMAGFARRVPDDGFPLFRFPYTVCLTTYEKNFSLRSK